MKCPKCNTFMSNDKNFCSQCGEKLLNNNTHQTQFDYSSNYSNTTKSYDDTHYDQFSYSKLYSNMLNQTVTSDEDYIKNYIGPNYEKIKSEGFSIPAFFLGPIYFLYRKLWIFAIIYLVGVSLLITYTSDNSTMLVILVTQVFLGLKFNSIYLNQVNKKVEEIKISNPDKSSTELLNLCKKKGGISIKTTVIMCILTFFIMIGYYTEDTITIDNTQENNNVSEQTNKIGDLTYTAPDSFNKSSYSADNYHDYIYKDNNNTYCSINITTNKYVNIYSNEEELLKKYVAVKEQDPVFGKELLGNHTWTFYGKPSEQFIYTIKYKNTYYLVEAYNYFNNPNDDSCYRLVKHLIDTSKLN